MIRDYTYSAALNAKLQGVPRELGQMAWEINICNDVMARKPELNTGSVQYLIKSDETLTN